jgi:type VI secretion system secreted protein VgrG
MWAGSRFGGVNVPRNGEEVIVEFLEGDPDRPIITGRVYNANNMPPYELPVNKTQTGIKTRSTKDGPQDSCTPDNFNEIRFEDKKDKEELHMQAERDMSTLVKRNQSLSVGANRDISVGGDETTTINKIRRLHVVEDEFINIDGNHTNTVCKDVVETFMQNQDIDITQDKTEHVKQVYTLTTDQKFSLNQSATNLTFEGTNVTLDAAGTVLVKRGPAELLMDGAGKIKLSTPASITLECGPSKIEMTPAGIKLTSVQVIAEGTPSKLELGPVAASLSGAMVKVEAQTICSVMGMATLKLNTP